MAVTRPLQSQMDERGLGECLMAKKKEHVDGGRTPHPVRVGFHQFRSYSESESDLFALARNVMAASSSEHYSRNFGN